MNRDVDIYVLLTNTGTLFSKTIQLYTKNLLNHASIAFDSDLNEVYSFGRKNPSNPFFAGFVKEDVRGPFFEDSICSLYKCTVTHCAYICIRNQIRYMEQNRDQYKYNLLGMLGIMLNIEMKRDYAYFCSQFVASVFEQSGVNLVDKPSLFVTPGDLEQTPMLELVYHGKLHAYTGCQEELQATGAFQTA
ncbi:hypothetical protein L1N85_12355 [Paenibacillus alkaliterrae]|uniref:hypothetical protein n=1 Tax=Paenibacillus alkaliterrae TaxID=320909 RepID=UPI001F27A85A|nr:hypothetical protein [Paenibacillus alkaliterrae]MCF2939226.1 hypothetical protein [Paenibacillus alkaliterrae]